LELIIILVLLSIASSVFQAINQDKGKGAAKGTKPSMTASPSKSIKSPSMTATPGGQPRIQRRPAAAPIEELLQESSSIRAFDYMDFTDGVEAENPAKAVESLQVEALPEEERFIIGNMGLGDLQRSIVMAELLGKPRALKGFKR
jgi:hypothetical protein